MKSSDKIIFPTQLDQELLMFLKNTTLQDILHHLLPITLSIYNLKMEDFYAQNLLTQNYLHWEWRVKDLKRSNNLQDQAITFKRIAWREMLNIFCPIIKETEQELSIRQPDLQEINGQTLRIQHQEITTWIQILACMVMQSTIKH